MFSGFLLAGCGSNNASSSDAAPQGPSSDAPNDAIVVTSSDFVEGGTIPVANTCTGANTSPPLAWTGAPAGTKSFAVVLTDLSITLTHWVIYDIPARTTDLPAHIENVYAPGGIAGAHQTPSGAGASVIGYVGPCPRRAPPVHMYQFAVYALDITMLSGVSAQSTAPEAIAQIAAHRLDGGTLTASYGF